MHVLDDLKAVGTINRLVISPIGVVLEKSRAGSFF